MTRRSIHRASGVPALTAAVAATLALGGCMSFIPAYERPTGAAAADIEWQRFFADPRLKRLIELSLQNNRDLRVAILNIEQARASYRIQRADELPSVGAGVQAQRQPGADGLANTYAVGLQVTGFELDFFGRVRSLSQAALA
ncbi:MAG: TolC family protein, partial [Rhizobiales bacterium]|nr:TolC family protein [Rhizobacter sp.]